jgi:MOSC domain-containing protein YiiM
MGNVISVSARDGHGLGKTRRQLIQLIAGEGVVGDAHRGVTVKHRSRVAKDPTQPNLRQIHLIHSELLDELAMQGFAVAPGALGENILTRGIDLLGLSAGALLHIGQTVQVEITGLRNPCHQINGHSAGLMNALISHRDDGTLIRRGGIMGIVRVGGEITIGDQITPYRPNHTYEALMPV